MHLYVFKIPSASVLQDLQLVWQATLNRVPVTLAVAKFGLFSGMVCSLDEGGVLSVCYQGTDPPTSAVVDAATKEMDYEHINQEHRKLLQVCRKFRKVKSVLVST